MAVYKIYPTKDASIYSEYPSMNTGLDQILEASTYVKNAAGQTSRYLLKFSQTEINNVFDTYVTSSTIAKRNYQVNLRNYAALVTNLNEDTTLKIYPVSQSWNMGTGKFGNDPETQNGVTWMFKNSSGSGKWIDGPLNNNTTASYNSAIGGNGGGTWYTGSTSGLDITQSQILSYSDPLDVKVDVTNTVKIWISQSKAISGGDIPNEGFLVKQTKTVEFIPSESKAQTIRYYSIDTNTIYPPLLDFKFDDYTWNTGSSTNTILDNAEAFMSIYNNQNTYFTQSVERFRIAAIPKYPTRTFSTSSIYTTNYFLPTASYYAIKDSETNEYVIEFDDVYTKISADSKSSYFDVYMNGLEPERYYTILIKTTLDGTMNVFDENINFKVING